MPNRASTDSPPLVRAGRGKVVLLATAGLVLAGMLIAALISLDRKDDSSHASDASPDVRELVPPAVLDELDQQAGINDVERSADLVGAQRGNIQVTDPDTGRLSQQYRWRQSTPLPDGKLELEDPVVELYLSDDQVLTMQGQQAMVRAPDRALEAGDIRGSVLIRLYEVRNGAQPDFETDRPVMQVRTDEASFDNVQGEVRCPGWVDIQTIDAHLPGENLRFQINEPQERVEWLEIARVGQVRVRNLDAAISSESANNGTTRPTAAVTRSARPALPADSPRARRPAVPRSPDTPNAVATNKDPQFYRLVFERDVRIQQGSGDEGWIASGDVLAITFAVESRDSESNASSAHGPHLQRHAAMSVPAALVELLVAAQPSNVTNELFIPGDQDAIITCAGPLRMEPLRNAADRPASADDARFELNGAPVTVAQPSESLDVRCGSLRYSTASQRVELVGSELHPLVITTPQLQASGSVFWLNRATATGGFERTGELHLREDTAPDAESRAVRITWNHGVDLAFAESAQENSAATDGKTNGALGRLRNAVFRGDVAVRSPDVQMDAGRMEVGFTPANLDLAAEDSKRQPRQQIESIDATERVHLTGQGDDGSIDSDHLHVQFAHDAGRTFPIRMDADGGVKVTDPDRQTIWSNNLSVTFRRTQDVQDEANEGRSVDAEIIRADGDVQVLMADGARAFADALEADAAQESAVLTSNPDDGGVMIVSGDAVLHRGTRLEIRQADSRADWAGGGEFIQLAEPPPVDPSGRVARPTIDPAAAPVRARWRDSMAYDSRAAEGAGEITLRGAVEAVSSPNSLEWNSMTGGQVILQFERTQPAASQPDAAATQPAPRSEAFTSGSRRLRRFMASDDARLESHAWVTPQHTDVSRVFAVTGDQIEHDGLTLDSVVRGPGTLLVRDERTESGAATQPESDQIEHGGSFSARGTTGFAWKTGLRMSRTSHDRYAIVMDGSVEVRHLAIDKSISTLTGDRLEAEVQRAAGVADPNESFDLGGHMDLKKLRGIGRIYINTPTRDVQCDRFEYDYDTGLAMLEADEGRVVSVTTTATVQPIKARNVVWHIREDRIVATNVAGSGGR